MNACKVPDDVVREGVRLLKRKFVEWGTLVVLPAEHVIEGVVRSLLGDFEIASSEETE